MEIIHNESVKLWGVSIGKKRSIQAYPDVGVHDKRQSKDAIQHWVSRWRGGNCGSGQRNEASRQETLKGPVVGAVESGWRRERGGVVDGARQDG